MNINFLNQINLGKFLDSSYIFEVTPNSGGLYRYLAIPFAAALIMAVLLIKNLKKQEEVYKKLQSKIINLLLFFSLFGFLFLFFRFESMPYLGSRFLMLALAGFLLIWALAVIFYKYFILPKEIEKHQKQKIFDKYLP